MSFNVNQNQLRKTKKADPGVKRIIRQLSE